MTDAELFMKMRASFREAEAFVEAAADRIEALLKVTRIHEELEAELLETQNRANAFATKEYYTEMRAERAEAKLAKAVEALQFYAWENETRLPSDGPWGAGSTDFGKIARTTLAEIKGESHE